MFLVSVISNINFWCFFCWFVVCLILFFSGDKKNSNIVASWMSNDSKRVKDVAISPNGVQIMVCCADGSVKLFKFDEQSMSDGNGQICLQKNVDSQLTIFESLPLKEDDNKVQNRLSYNAGEQAQCVFLSDSGVCWTTGNGVHCAIKQENGAFYFWNQCHVTNHKTDINSFQFDKQNDVLAILEI